MADERDPTCNPMDPLLERSSHHDSTHHPSHSAADDATPMIDMAPQPENPSSVGDYSSFDIVKATQYGAIQRCVYLIESKQADVNSPDAENVYPLHWAAINNRLELVRYYISKGAVIDKRGGDLNSTPMHWATRQGHIGMVVLLMTQGADPTLLDGEGLSCIHLAAQFGHTPIVAYFVAKGVNVDLRDQNGMTPLMIAASKVFAADPARLLLTFNANPHLTDHIQHNNALHWACEAGNHIVIPALVKAGVNIEARNNKNERPLDVASRKNALYVVKKLMEEDVAKGISKENWYLRLISDTKLRNKVMYALPFFVVFIIGFVAELSLIWYLKLLLFLAIAFLLKGIASSFVDHTFMLKAPVAIYLATKFWMYVTWFTYFWPYINSISVHIIFVLNTIFLCKNFYLAWKTDPGYIEDNSESKMKLVVSLAEAPGSDFSELCSTCIIRKPVRSKHCSVCNKCVAKFDHHCPWVDNCVGANNHRYFINYLMYLLGMLSFCIYGCVQYWMNACDLSGDFQVMRVISCSGWVFWIALNAGFHFCWVAALLFSQAYQVMLLGLTTNERLNFKRYTHLRGKQGKNPFHRGYLQNCFDVMQWRFCGLYRPTKIDWLHTYKVAGMDDEPPYPRAANMGGHGHGHGGGHGHSHGDGHGHSHGGGHGHSHGGFRQGSGAMHIMEEGRKAFDI